MRPLIINWLITSLSLYVAFSLVEGIHYHGPLAGLLIIAAVFGLVNAVVKPVMVIFSLPFIVLSLGLFLLIVNGLMLGLTAWLAGPELRIDGLGAAVWGSIIISLVSWALHVALGDRERPRERE